MKKTIFVVLTSSGYWGKGESLSEAITNANANPHPQYKNTEMQITIIETENPDDISIGSMGGITYNVDDKIIHASKPSNTWDLIGLNNDNDTLEFIIELLQTTDDTDRKRWEKLNKAYEIISEVACELQ